MEAIAHIEFIMNYIIFPLMADESLECELKKKQLHKCVLLWGTWERTLRD